MLTHPTIEKLLRHAKLGYSASLEDVDFSTSRPRVLFRASGSRRLRLILAYVAAHNDNGTPFKWTKTADDILDKMRRFGLRTQQVHVQ